MSRIKPYSLCNGLTAVNAAFSLNPTSLDRAGVVGFHPGQLNTTGTKIAPGSTVRIALHSGNLDIPSGKPEFVVSRSSDAIFGRSPDFERAVK